MENPLATETADQFAAFILRAIFSANSLHGRQSTLGVGHFIVAGYGDVALLRDPYRLSYPEMLDLGDVSQY